LAFASAKAGLRAVVSGLAREFGPKGVHVARVIIDGGIRGKMISERALERIEAASKNGMLLPSAIAKNYWQIHLQHPSAWTFEMDLRPYKEVF
jgi:NAD(P)-dependent dehydrogenase (short-subunit alcohol dehydrogenase family)